MDSMSSQTQESASAADQHYYKETFDPGRIARAYGAQLGILGVFLSLWIIFIVSAPDTFLSSRIYFAFMSTIPFFAIMAVPLTMVVIAGEMDLSFPSIMAMGMVAFSFIYDATASLASVPTRVFLAFIAALVSGSLIGWLNGLIIVKFRIPSLVATTPSGEPSPQLRQDHPGVASCSHQRPIVNSLCHAAQVRLIRPGDLLVRAPHRQQHVRPGVAVRYRKHVQRVHLLVVPFQPGQPCRCQLLENLPIARRHRAGRLWVALLRHRLSPRPYSSATRRPWTYTLTW